MVDERIPVALPALIDVISPPLYMRQAAMGGVLLKLHYNHNNTLITLTIMIVSLTNWSSKVDNTAHKH